MSSEIFKSSKISLTANGSYAPLLKTECVPEFTIPYRDRSQSLLTIQNIPPSRRHQHCRQSGLSHQVPIIELSMRSLSEEKGSRHQSRLSIAGSPRIRTSRRSSMCNSVDFTSTKSDSNTLSVYELPSINEVESLQSQFDPSLYIEEEELASTEESENESEMTKPVSAVHRIRCNVKYQICDEKMNVAITELRSLAAVCPVEGNGSQQIITKIELLGQDKGKAVTSVCVSRKHGNSSTESVIFKKVTPEEMLRGKLRFSSYTSGRIFKKGHHLGGSVVDICSNNFCPFTNQVTLKNSKNFGRVLLSMRYEMMRRKLIVTVVRCEGLRRRLLTVPYVKLTLMNNGGTEVSSQQSGRKWFTRHPVFKRSFLFQLPQTNRLESSMRLTISDRNLLRADEKLGDLIFCWPKEKWQETTTTLQWRKVLKNPGQVVDAWHDVAYSL
ncbi:hypothetical protein BSL78_01150 [Apostichopus japonicus]|uniref:C2 domain-containing protein n=1 Tax=Stichopus japonicus TaxID=307972 RepID=A0A2G8LNW0_STIJA|nr:hypothetical protein BSL78_01150 [Apostichopus japonicus]